MTNKVIDENSSIVDILNSMMDVLDNLNDRIHVMEVQLGIVKEEEAQ